MNVSDVGRSDEPFDARAVEEYLKIRYFGRKEREEGNVTRERPGF